MKSINVAVIGCGVWGRNHARVFNDMENVELKYVSDIDEKTAERISRKYQTNYCVGVEEVIGNPEIDAITVCTPTITHARIAEQSIKAGKHVLVEKPMTNTIQEAWKLVHLSKLHKTHLAVGFIERFNPAVNEAFNYISKGKIGDVILAHAKRVSRWPVRIGDVGVIKDLAIHDIDIVNKLFEVEANLVFANAGKIQHTFEDYANILMSFPENKVAFIETNWLTPRKVRTLSITGTEGIIHIEYITQTVTIEDENQMIQPFIKKGEPLRLELECFVNSILNDKPQKVTGLDGIKALKICEAALESAKFGTTMINEPDSSLF